MNRSFVTYFIVLHAPCKIFLQMVHVIVLVYPVIIVSVVVFDCVWTCMAVCICVGLCVLVRG